EQHGFNLIYYHFISGPVMALIGSLLSVLVNCYIFQAVVMPALCFLKIVGGKATTTQVTLSVIIAACGITSALIGTYSSLSKIVQNESHRDLHI
ncbi:Amino acid transporter AVT1A, partial [Glycine soja]